MITEERIKELFYYCEDCGNFFWKKASRGIKKNKKAGCKNSLGYIVIGVDGFLHYSHRMAWLLKYGYIPEEIDHINRDTSDNRIENLREATRSENSFNKPKRACNTSGYKGVTFCKQTNKWRAQLTVNKKRINLGRFNKKEDAAIAYNNAANIHQKDFAYNNKTGERK